MNVRKLYSAPARWAVLCVASVLASCVPPRPGPLLTSYGRAVQRLDNISMLRDCLFGGNHVTINPEAIDQQYTEAEQACISFRQQAIAALTRDVETAYELEIRWAPSCLGAFKVPASVLRTLELNPELPFATERAVTRGHVVQGIAGTKCAKAVCDWPLLIDMKLAAPYCKLTKSNEGRSTI